jgi:hypothetical protein
MYDASLIFYLGLRAQTCSTVDECYSWQAGVNAYFFSAATLGRRDDPRILAARLPSADQTLCVASLGLESRRDFARPFEGRVPGVRARGGAVVELQPNAAGDEIADNYRHRRYRRGRNLVGR